MDHPHHDDSHLPESIEKTPERIEKLCHQIVDQMTVDDWREYTWDVLEKEYEKDTEKFEQDWIEYMEE